MHLPLIGDKLVLLHVLRIKANVDLAGHSQLLDLWKVLIKLKLENYYPSQSNNWLIAQEAMETKVAMEDSMTMPLTMPTTML